jgi:hypothetical protein
MAWQVRKATILKGVSTYALPYPTAVVLRHLVVLSIPNVDAKRSF